MDIMIDIETLGLRPGCVILQIGWAMMDTADLKVVDSGAIGLDIAQQLAAGRWVDPATHDWWMAQPEDLRSEVFEGTPTSPPVAPTTGLLHLSDLVTSQGVQRVWAGPTHFDIAILDEASHFWNSEQLWPHGIVRDLRSYMEAAGLTDKIASERPHHARFDAVAQAESLFAAMKQLRAF